MANLAAAILRSLTFDIDDSLFTTIERTFLSLAKDRDPGVRACSVVALERIQNPSCPDCPVTALYLNLLQGDSSAQVRKAILECMGITPLSVPEMLLRARDVKSDVREKLFLEFSKRCSIASLQVEERVALLEQGLGDRCARVQAACFTLLQKWTKECGGSVVGLLSH